MGLAFGIVANDGEPRTGAHQVGGVFPDDLAAGTAERERDGIAQVDTGASSVRRDLVARETAAGRPVRVVDVDSG